MGAASSLSYLLPLALRATLRALPPMVVAFSGGLDSRFLCHAAQICGRKVTAIHVSGPHVPEKESIEARAWARRHDLPFIEVALNPLGVPEIAANGKDRCYFCKRVIFGKVLELARQGQPGAFCLCDGGNLDDDREFRPGRKAVRELGVISPLSQAALGKEAIRHYAALTAMEDPGQLARPCLFTRFAYGVRPSLEELARLGKAEAEISAFLLAQGARRTDFRLRLLPEAVLYINPVSDGMLQSIRVLLEACGFPACGFVQTDRISGYYDRLASNSGD